MPGITIDDSRWPLVVVTTIGVCSDEEFESYLSWMTRSLQRKTRVALIIDTSQAGRTPTQQRQRQAQWMKEHKDVLALYSAGLAFVATSAIFRFVLSGIFLIQGPPCSYCVVGTLQEAERWSRKQLAGV